MYKAYSEKICTACNYTITGYGFDDESMETAERIAIACLISHTEAHELKFSHKMNVVEEKSYHEEVNSFINEL